MACKSGNPGENTSGAEWQGYGWQIGSELFTTGISRVFPCTVVLPSTMHRVQPDQEGEREGPLSLTHSYAAKPRAVTPVPTRKGNQGRCRPAGRMVRLTACGEGPLWWCAHELRASAMMPYHEGGPQSPLLSRRPSLGLQNLCWLQSLVGFPV